MKSGEALEPKLKLSALRTQLVTWLTDAAYPLWSRNGIDPLNGGFIETLGQNAAALPHPRRARVHPRQIYAFAQAPKFGWNGDVPRIVRRGSDYFISFYERPDGLFRTLTAIDGAPLDGRAVLYDQAFALLGFAAAGNALPARAEFEQRALKLRDAVEAAFRAPNGAFYSHENQQGIHESNPHMHLLEAALAWAEISDAPGWTVWVRQLVELALEKFIRPDNGALGEAFTADWRPAPGIAGRIVEPGHQFEWAWLLLRAEARQSDAQNSEAHRSEAHHSEAQPSEARHAEDHHAASEYSRRLRTAALRLIAIGEQAGVVNRVAINALLDDLSVHDPNARFWPQTERLKAALLAARLTGEEKYWRMAADAAAAWLPYLATPVAGLWWDVKLPGGEMVDSPAPASTFYHLVGAIVALDAALAG